MTTVDNRQPLFRTAGGQRLHIEPCPHIHGAQVFAATAEDRMRLEICAWSQAELAGFGRQYHDTLRDAMRVFKTYVGTEALIEKAVAGIEYDKVFTVNSGSYIALGHDGLGVAWIGKTWVVLRGGQLIQLPGYAPHAGGGSEKDVKYGALCPVHFEVMSLTGQCSSCL